MCMIDVAKAYGTDSMSFSLLYMYTRLYFFGRHAALSMPLNTALLCTRDNNRRMRLWGMYVSVGKNAKWNEEDENIATMAKDDDRYDRQDVDEEKWRVNEGDQLENGQHVAHRLATKTTPRIT
jgi:hypothetical protein